MQLLMTEIYLHNLSRLLNIMCCMDENDIFNSDTAIENINFVLV